MVNCHFVINVLILNLFLYFSGNFWALRKNHLIMLHRTKRKLWWKIFPLDFQTPLQQQLIYYFAGECCTKMHFGQILSSYELSKICTHFLALFWTAHVLKVSKNRRSFRFLLTFTYLDKVYLKTFYDIPTHSYVLIRNLWMILNRFFYVWKPAILNHFVLLSKVCYWEENISKNYFNRQCPLF